MKVATYKSMQLTIKTVCAYTRLFSLFSFKFFWSSVEEFVILPQLLDSFTLQNVRGHILRPES